MQRTRELIGWKASTARRAAATLQPLGGGNSTLVGVAHQAPAHGNSTPLREEWGASGDIDTEPNA